MNETLILILSNLITGLAGWFAGRRKINAQTDNQVLKNLELSIMVYRTIIDDLKNEIKELNDKVEKLETKINELHQENMKLKTNANSNTTSRRKS